MDNKKQEENAKLAPFGDLGRRIKQVRDYLDIGQESLAGALGVSLGSLNRYEKGWRQMPAAKLQKLARMGKDVSVDWLLSGEGDMHDVEPPRPSAVSNLGANPGALSFDQVGKLLAAAERERLTPDERALLLKYQSLPPAQRARLWDLVNAGAADPPEPPAERVNDVEKRRGER